ncbi:hypothetical protein [Burkholderia ubonensis]|uniref:Lipopolysaccharide assembly protein B n=1 Tax=Burkholderia ubonensis TaxID=101571 RepID=A0AB74D6K3_9BURK|nr:hypothetical protein [Burkholderia ubonensis]PAJ76601.1 hypothetical protein CJO71_34400 [Burkholderia ubonensis]PAJ84082.1 hypothetical protein CJO70_29040 [Burkholderia ubonensis]PAJ91493.1 hypothetical protein CJO69_26305 [Burkholderia ubonensis]PAJ97884.1 hypothetical protein CJO68_27335 [Burkholderia ubonensis]PAK04918.1 hypothetical protein CJO67_27255 [Burkholderia ubonensis]
MQVLLSRKVIARDTLTGALNAHARSRQAAGYRCSQCGFVAFRALEHCPVCGKWNWPFDARAGSPARPSFDSWPVRIARFLHHVAIHQPRPSSAPMLSLATLVLVFGGYVALDRMCQADPACRAPNLPSASAIIGDLRAPADLAPPLVSLPGDPALPMLPLPAYPFHALDEAQLAADAPAGPSVDQPADRTIASAAPAGVRHASAARAPGTMVAARPCKAHAALGCARAHVAPIRTAELRNRPSVTHHAPPIRPVDARPEPARQQQASNGMHATRLYHGH